MNTSDRKGGASRRRNAEVSLLTLIHSANIPWPDSCFARGLSLLPAELHSSVQRFRSPRDRQSRLAARLLLRIGLKFLGCEASLLSWGVSREGKPFLAGYPAHFSFSHAPGLTVVALSLSGPVGVDAELPHALRLEDAGRLLCDEEHAHVRAALNPEGELARLWTIKEAVFKAQGRGPGFDPALLNVLGETVCLCGEVWRIMPVETGGDHFCSLVSRSDEACTVLYCDDCDLVDAAG